MIIFDRLSEALSVIKRLIYHEFDAYDNGLNTISINHYNDPENGVDCWSLSITINCRTLLNMEEKWDREARIHKLIELIYPTFPHFVLHVESIDPVTTSKATTD